jgi:hypothetical protein
MNSEGMRVNGHLSPLFTKQEAARYMRLDVSSPCDPEAAIDRLLAKGELQRTKMGKCVMFHIDELNRYIEAQRE